MTNMNHEQGAYDMYPNDEVWVGVGFPAEHGGLGHAGYMGFEVTEPSTADGKRRVQDMLNNYFSSSRSDLQVSEGQQHAS